jgi:hypothetical protein
MSVPDEMSGQVSPCPKCGEDVYLDPADASRRSSDQRSDQIRAMRAAAIASRPDGMPRVTWEWAFDAVLKITVAAAVIDGALSVLIWMTIRLFSRR